MLSFQVDGMLLGVEASLSEAPQPASAVEEVNVCLDINCAYHDIAMSAHQFQV